MMKRLFLPFLFSFFCLFQIQSLMSDEWNRVFLASYPRSGNHWIRFLIEESSGIATGSVYIDKEPLHMDKVFPWGGYCCDHGLTGNCRYPKKKESILIKTHFPSQPTKVTEFDRLPSKEIIRLVRHPVDSFYSRYVRQPRGPLLDKVPTDRVKEFIANWRKFQTYWNHQKNVTTIIYEDLLENPAPVLRKVLRILNYEFTNADINRAIDQHPPEGHMLKHIDKFHKEDLKLIAEELGEWLEQFGYEIPVN